MSHINVIGAGLAGAEAAHQIAKYGIDVKLYEMKPKKHSPAHKLDTFAELVCSNSLRSDKIENAVGLLKREMEIMGSVIMESALENKVPAGGALAVDREKFSQAVTDRIKENKHIEVIEEEVVDIPDDEITIIASGPLTSDPLVESIQKLIHEDYLYFYDAAAPIVLIQSVDKTKVFQADRYGKGTSDYINCPMNREEYEAFWNELVNAELAEIKDFEKEVLFSGCMPVESMAKNGIDTLRFGPLKPVGLVDPNTGKEPYAVVQLRQDDKSATMYNIVGFQTRLKWPEQKRVFSMIPGLENAEFVRYGVMHKNTFINSPTLLDNTYNLKEKPNIYFAGQITGVEGYIESAASGMVAGINAAMKHMGKDKVIFPQKTALGALANYVSEGQQKNFQPMNVNFGIIESLEERVRDKKQRYTMIAERSLDIIKNSNDELQGEQI